MGQGGQLDCGVKVRVGVRGEEGEGTGRDLRTRGWVPRGFGAPAPVRPPGTPILAQEGLLANYFSRELEELKIM